MVDKAMIISANILYDKLTKTRINEYYSMFTSFETNLGSVDLLNFSPFRSQVFFPTREVILEWDHACCKKLTKNIHSDICVFRLRFHDVTWFELSEVLVESMDFETDYEIIDVVSTECILISHIKDFTRFDFILSNHYKFAVKSRCIVCEFEVPDGI